MVSIVVLGAGNVAFHLVKSLSNSRVIVKQVYNRTLSKAKEIAYENNISFTDDFSKIEKADIYIIAVSDTYVSDVSKKIKCKDCLVLHTSGSLSLDSLVGSYRKGVMYPLQTFSKNRMVSFKEIPFLIEAENKLNLKIIQDLCSEISNNVQEMSYPSRKKMQMAGVVVSNFTNYMYNWGAEITEDLGYGFNLLRPLILETAKKTEKLNPLEAQTGPAKRGDELIIKKHLDMLSSEKKKQLYDMISKAIKENYD